MIDWAKGIDLKILVLIGTGLFTFSVVSQMTADFQDAVDENEEPKPKKATKQTKALNKTTFSGCCETLNDIFSTLPTHILWNKSLRAPIISCLLQFQNQNILNVETTIDFFTLPNGKQDFETVSGLLKQLESLQSPLSESSLIETEI